MHKLPCKLLRPSFSKNPVNRTQKACSAVALLLMCILWYRSFLSKWCSPSVLRLQLDPQHSACGQPGQPSLENSCWQLKCQCCCTFWLLHEENLDPWERPLALACPLTTGTLLNTLEAATFAASCQSDPFWHLKGNWSNVSSNKQRDKRTETERTQNKRLQVSLSKRATQVHDYFSVCTLVNLFTVFAYFHIASRTGLGIMCLLGWERRKKTLNKSTWDFPFLVPIHHFCDSWAKNTLLNMRTYGHRRNLLINASSAISTQNHRQLSKPQHHWVLKTLLSLSTSYSKQACQSHGLLPCSLGKTSK